MHDRHARKNLLQGTSGRLALLGLGAVAVVSVLPLLVDTPPVRHIVAYASDQARWESKFLVLAAMALAVVWRACADRREPWVCTRFVVLAGLAALCTICHLYWVDLNSAAAAWQLDMYYRILNHTAEPPHQFRPLPYGFARTLERLTGDWLFAGTAYRWFFTFWFLWASDRFARLFHTPLRALACVLAIPALYPLSIGWYWGQLTDPLSHALFVLALVYVIEDRVVPLAAALALGVVAKETVVIVVPAYWACYWRRGLPALRAAAVLGTVCTAAFLATRLPYGWRPGAEDMNGAGLMIASNLGFPERYIRYVSGAPVYLNYVHPLIFVGTFLPFIAWRWRQIDGRLRALCLTLVPLLLASNLCFGWMYESRNYMPLVPLLATMAMPPNKRAIS